MRIINTIPELRSWNAESAAAGERPRVFVPTMGALHEGHLSLMDIARTRAGEKGKVVVSIFVNPAQFAPHEDFDSYPRELESDFEKCAGRGVDVIFVPERRAVYAADDSVRVVEEKLSAGQEGASRPRFFAGVCTVVAKLFHLVEPDAAVFGEKDFQQLAVIRRMVRDLHFPIEILAGPTMREPDGLAMSSRNAYLSAEEREQAPVIQRALGEAIAAIDAGATDAAGLVARVRERIGSAPLARIDYVEAIHPDTFEPVDEITGAVLLAAAVFFGKTRLIDNRGWRCE